MAISGVPDYTFIMWQSWPLAQLTFMGTSRFEGGSRIFPILSILFGWFWPYGAQLGKWAALVCDKGVIWDTLLL